MAFIAPILDEVISGIYDVQFEAVVDAIAHQLEYSLNGGIDWTVIDSNIIIEPVDGVVTYPWDTTPLGNAVDVILRARGIFV